MAIAETVQSFLTAKHAQFKLEPHRRTYSTRETAHAAHVSEDHIAKAVIVRDAHGYAMAVIPGDNWLKLHALRAEANRLFELAAEPEVNKLFRDCKPGAIPPIGPAYGLETFMDERLTALADLYFEAGDHEHLVHVHGNTFRALLQGVRHGHFSHDG